MTLTHQGWELAGVAVSASRIAGPAIGQSHGVELLLMRFAAFAAERVLLAA